MFLCKSWFSTFSLNICQDIHFTDLLIKNEIFTYKNYLFYLQKLNFYMQKLNFYINKFNFYIQFFFFNFCNIDFFVWRLCFLINFISFIFYFLFSSYRWYVLVSNTSWMIIDQYVVWGWGGVLKIGLLWKNLKAFSCMKDALIKINNSSKDLISLFFCHINESWYIY